MVHRLKIWPEPFGLMEYGLKQDEVRLNDRGFQVGDTLVLCEWDGESFSGREHLRTIRAICPLPLSRLVVLCLNNPRIDDLEATIATILTEKGSAFEMLPPEIRKPFSAEVE